MPIVINGHKYTFASSFYNITAKMVMYSFSEEKLCVKKTVILN